MSKDFRIIVITAPGDVDREAEKIIALLGAVVDYVHIRKPSASLRDVRNLIEDIPYQYRRRLRLHGHFDLCHEYNLAGVHLNHRNPVPPPGVVSVTRSCHSLADLDDASLYEYVTLSPIYDSISKPGYRSAFAPDKIGEKIRGRNVMALGGVSPENFGELRKTGFAGSALLGYIWNNDFQKSLDSLIAGLTLNHLIV